MEQFLRQLQTIPEAAELIRRVEEGGCPAAVSGLQPVQRACVGAAVAAACGRPAVFLCGDEREVQVLSADLETLTGRRPVTLLGREWQFRPGAVGSRDWERSRLAALYALAQGDAPVVVATADGLMARTLPPETLRSLAITLEVGGQAELGALAEQLLSAGYTRCEQVEGVGQFALRGGILDFFSPAHPKPVRVEFFGDEIDAMGLFDPDTQRRIENLGAAEILPAAEVLPQFTPGGYGGLLDGLDRLISQAKRRKGSETLVQTLEEDRERLSASTAFPAMDRYIALIYPDDGTSCIPDGGALVQGAPHPENARKFLDFIAGNDVQSRLETEFSRRPVREGVESGGVLRPLEELVLVDYDLAWTVEHHDSILMSWAFYLGGGEEP